MTAKACWLYGLHLRSKLRRDVCVGHPREQRRINLLALRFRQTTDATHFHMIVSIARDYSVKIHMQQHTEVREIIPGLARLLLRHRDAATSMADCMHVAKQKRWSLTAQRIGQLVAGMPARWSVPQLAQTHRWFGLGTTRR